MYNVAWLKEHCPGYDLHTQWIASERCWVAKLYNGARLIASDKALISRSAAVANLTDKLKAIDKERESFVQERL